MKRKRNKGQVTLFAIVGIITVVAIIVLAIVLSNINKNKGEFLNPKQYIDSCVKEEIAKPLKPLMDNGGVINSSLAIFYLNEKYTYLCYTPNFFEGCKNLYPDLNLAVADEIKSKIEPGINECFLSLKKWYEARGYSLNNVNPALDVRIAPNKISVKINGRLEIKKEQEIQLFDNFNSEINSDLFDFISVAREIVNDESKFCKFYYMEYTLANPQYRMRMISYDDSHIYRIKKVNSDKEFKFATRGCIQWRGEND